MNFLLFIEGLQGFRTLNGLLLRGATVKEVVLPKGYSCDEIVNLCKDRDVPFCWRGKQPLLLAPDSADVLVSSQFQYRIDPMELRAGKLGSVNIHASMLPTYRGRHSDVWALINGESVLGVSVHRITHDFDAGQVLHIERTSISDDMTHSEIYLRMSRCLEPILDKLVDGSIFNCLETGLGPDVYWRTRTLADSRINWHLDSIKVFHFVRALARPPIFAFSEYLGRRYQFVNVQVKSAARQELPGSVVVADGEKGVVCGDRHLVIIRELVEPLAPQEGAVLH